MKTCATTARTRELYARAAAAARPHPYPYPPVPTRTRPSPPVRVSRRSPPLGMSPAATLLPRVASTARLAPPMLLTAATACGRGQVPPNFIIPGYRFGKDLVPVSGADSARIKFAVEQKSLQLIGCVPQSDMPRHLLASRAECVVADPDAPNANLALQAFLLALEEQVSTSGARG